MKKSSNQKKRERAPAKTRRKVTVTPEKNIKGGVPTIRLLKGQGMSKGWSDLHTKVGMKVTMSCLTLKIGYLPQNGVRKTLKGLAP